MMVSAINWVMLGIAAAGSAARQPRCGTAYSLGIGINRNDLCHNRLQKVGAVLRGESLGLGAGAL